jgi:hypothetical protein
MKRRTFLLSTVSIASGALALTSVTARAADPVKPSVALAFKTGGKLSFVRGYRMVEGALMVMIRANGRDRYFRVKATRKQMEIFSRAVEAGSFSVEDSKVKITRNGTNVAFSVTGKDGQTTSGAGVSDQPSSQSLAFLFLIIAVAVVGLLIHRHNIEGTIKVSTEDNGSTEFSYGEDNGQSGDGFIAEPECDEFPPLLC